MTSTDQQPDAPKMYCKKCGYVIEHLTSRRCPECGTRFDPQDSQSFRRFPITRWSRLTEWVSICFERAAETPNPKRIAHTIGYFFVVIALGALIIILDHFGLLHAYAAR